MRESVTYPAILEEGAALGEIRGRLDEAERLLLCVGRKRFGPPDERVAAAIEAIAEPGWAEALTERLLDVFGWDELMAPTGPG